MLSTDIEVKLSPRSPAVLARTMGRKEARYGFAARRRRSSPTPFERDLAFDCSPAELEGRKRQRAADAAWRAQVSKWERIEALSPASRAKLALWRQRREEEADLVDRLAVIQAEQRALRDAAETEWAAFNGVATAEQVDAFGHKYQKLYIPRNLEPVTIIPFPTPAPTPSEPLPDMIRSSAEFVEGFVPPDYLLDGVLQRRFCYSMTAQTGVGKTTVAMRISAHVATGRPLGGLDVQKGSVLYFAGENPTDVQMRWLGLTFSMGLDPSSTDVHFIPGAAPLSQVAERITAEVVRKGIQPALVVIDTAAAYFEGDDENSNTQAVDHAKRMRSLTTLPGGPSVLILCHPTKRAGDDDLIPRGGGAFLNEVDGNIALRKLDSLVTANALGKFRGPEFPPLNFELDTLRDHPRLRDTRGRQIPTVIARPIGADDQSRLERNGRMDEDAVLRFLCDHPGTSPTDVARALNWRLRAVGGKEPAVHHLKATRTLKRLEKEKLVETRRGVWYATQKGQKDTNASDAAVPSTPSCPLPFPLPQRPGTNEQG